MLPIVPVVCRALNHLVEQEQWAQQLLSQHNGKVVLFSTPLGEIYLQILAGCFANYSSAKQEDSSEEVIIQPAVTFTMSQEAIWSYLSGGKPAALKHIKIAGDVDFASDLNRLANDLHWEVEEDLAKLFGDALATKMTKRSKSVIQQGKSAILDLQNNLKSYLVHEKHLLVDQPSLSTLKSEIRILRDDVERTEKRIERLMQQTTTKRIL